MGYKGKLNKDGTLNECEYEGGDESLFVYSLNSAVSGQLQSQHEYKQQYDSTGKNEETNRFRLLISKEEFPKISLSLHIAFAIETHLAEVQWLLKQVNMLKLQKV